VCDCVIAVPVFANHLLDSGGFNSATLTCENLLCTCHVVSIMTIFRKYGCCSTSVAFVVSFVERRSVHGGEMKYSLAVPEDLCDKKGVCSAVLLLKD
jgi:prenyltransferase beta subunit